MMGVSNYWKRVAAAQAGAQVNRPKLDPGYRRADVQTVPPPTYA